MRTSYSFLALLQNAGFSRFMVGVVISAMVAPVYQPVSAAMDPVPDPEDAVQELDVPPGQALSHSVRKAKGLLGRAGQGLRRGEAISAERQELADLRRVVAELDTEVRREFERTGLLLAERKVPASIRARHEETFARYREEIETLLEDLVNIETETDEDSVASTIGRAYERLSQQKHQASQRPFDPNQLPHEAQRPPEDNLPRTTREEFLGAGLVDNPLVQLAAIEGYRLEGLPGADDPAYLGESTEVRLSPEVNAKAAELDHDPVAIYHWVRNHVEWLPTWGAVQDSDLTLSARRGNAMDTASLLIALLRASGIPARYVHGTIDVPEKAFRNWAGGFQHIEEAMNYAASGGIPLTGLIEGGNIAHVRMEHVWVEAAVDFLPSRGAVMREADTWLPLDPSFKQYEFLSGLDTLAITGSDGTQLIATLLEDGVYSKNEGSVSHLDQSTFVDAMREVVEVLNGHIQSLDSPTLSDIIGGIKPVVRVQPLLPSGLPYNKVLSGPRYSSLPKQVRPEIAFMIGSAATTDPANSVTFPWAAVNNRKVTLSFIPATPDDEAALKSLIPETGLSDPSKLPGSIPAYLIDVMPELRVDGQVVLQGSSISLGQELRFSYSVTDPVHGTRQYPKNVLAGSYLAVAVIGGNVAQRSISKVASQLRDSKETVLANSWSQGESLKREQVLGDFFHVGLLGYFGQYHSLGRIAANIGDAHFQMTTSLGTFGYVPRVAYFFGIPKSITGGGAMMDLDRVAFTANTDGQGRDAKAMLNFQLGTLASSLEHIVPEQMLVRDDSPGQAVSAVRAFEQALASDQTIYHVTPSNQAVALPKIRQNEAIMGEIRASLLSGREVIVHTEPITVPGWTGGGYIILDPDTGGGAWKIAGGANGGFLDNYPEDLVSLLLLMATGLAVVSGAPLSPFLALSLGAIATFNVFMTFLKTDLHLRESNCPRALSNLHLSLSVAFAALPSALPQYLGGVAISSFYSFIVGRSVNSAASACRVL